jgi:rhodanese-related sulfurtransferase
MNRYYTLPALLLAAALSFAACAQNGAQAGHAAVVGAQQSPSPAAQPKQDDRTVTAQPVILGDPDTPPAKSEAAQNRITVHELKAKMDASENLIILDVDGKYAWNARSIKIRGAIHVDPEQLEAGIKNLPKDKEVVTYCTCEKEATSGSVARTLLAKGFKKVSALVGGFRAWDDEAYPVEPKQ